MEQFFVLLISGLASFSAHHIGEWLFNKKRSVRLVLKGYHIHHSVFGALAILAAFISTGIYASVLFGYGIGNIWQHKRAHNKMEEKGMVFVTRHQNPQNLT